MAGLRLLAALALIGAGGCAAPIFFDPHDLTARDAQPDFRAERHVATGRSRGGKDVEALRVYPDHAKPDVFYYPPGRLRIARKRDGRPDLTFYQLRYTGSPERGDEGLFLTRSILGFRVIMEQASQEQLSRARAELRETSGRVCLQPMPIRRIVAGLVLTRLDPGRPQGSGETTVMPNGEFESSEGATGASGGFWTERYYSVELDDHTSNLVWDALHNQSVVMSFSYAFVAPGIPADEPLAELSGHPGAVAAVRRMLEEQGEALAGNESIVVRADAFAIKVDPEYMSTVMKRFDVESRLPPAFRLFTVYCFDFADELRPDLYEKHVEIEAEGINGRWVRSDVYFRAAEPDLTAQRVRFHHVVRMDRPYQYRVVEIALDGRRVVGEWIERDSWKHVLDVTTAPNLHQSPVAEAGAALQKEIEP